MGRNSDRGGDVTIPTLACFLVNGAFLPLSVESRNLFARMAQAPGRVTVFVVTAVGPLNVGGERGGDEEHGNSTMHPSCWII